MWERLGLTGELPGRGRQSAMLLLIILLEVGIATIDASVPQDVPVSHLYYVPIVIAAALYGYAGGTIVAITSLILFTLANYVWNVYDNPAFFVPSAALTFIYYLAVGLFAATFFARQRQLLSIDAHLRQRVGQLGALNQVALTVAATDDLTRTLRAIAVAVRDLSDTAVAGIVPFGTDEQEWAQAIVSDDPAGFARWPPFEPALAQSIAALGRTVVVDSTTQDVAVPSAPWQSLLALPLLLGGTAVGLLYAADTRVRRFAVEDQQPLETLAQQAADAIARSRLRARELDLALSGERNRLAREIHDNLAQSLLTVIMRLEALKLLLTQDTGRAYDELQRAETIARAALTDARRSVRGLRPASLEQRSLAETLRDEVATFGDVERVHAEYRVEGTATPLTAAAEDSLYSIAREALNNIRKHARAGTVTVVLAFAPEAAELRITDDGVGFMPALPTSDQAGHFGLVGMRERAQLLGGAFTLETAPGEGTTICVRVPRMPGTAPPDDRPVRVMVCDDHELVRRGIVDVLLTAASIAVVGEVAAGEEVVAGIKKYAPDVLLLDLRLPGIDGVEVIRRLQASHADVAVLLLTSFGDDPTLLDAVRAGARGCLLKDTPPAELLAAIKAVARGERVMGSLVLQHLFTPSDNQEGEALSPREVEVLQLVAAGARNKEIARSLGITERTAKAHVSHILQKLAVADRTEAVAAAFRRGLLRP